MVVNEKTLNTMTTLNKYSADLSLARTNPENLFVLTLLHSWYLS